MEWIINNTWDGRPAYKEEKTTLRAFFPREQTDSGAFTIEIHAPFHRDPAPSMPPGSTDSLWEYEVAELFLVGRNNRYIEMEFGPYGHYLVLLFSGIRQRSHNPLPISYKSVITEDRWQGTAHIPFHFLPEPIVSANAFSIHGTKEKRRYLAAHPTGGNQPDFHRIETFPAITQPPFPPYFAVDPKQGFSI